MVSDPNLLWYCHRKEQQPFDLVQIFPLAAGDSSVNEMSVEDLRCGELAGRIPWPLPSGQRSGASPKASTCGRSLNGSLAQQNEQLAQMADRRAAMTSVEMLRSDLAMAAYPSDAPQSHLIKQLLWVSLTHSVWACRADPVGPFLLVCGEAATAQMGRGRRSGYCAL